MALVDVDSWKTEFSACKRLSVDIRTQLNQARTVSVNKCVQARLRQFETELGQLNDKLAFSKENRSITAEEAYERQQQLTGLQTQLRQLFALFSNANDLDADRAALFAATSSGPITATGAMGGSDLNAVETLKQRQIGILEQQNRGLETLSQTISRQRALAAQLGHEVEDQNDILDNMANTIDRVESGVNAETRNIDVVNQRDSTWGYWLVIIALFVAILVVLLV